MYVTAGSDTYGRVKNVGGTPIVTKFAMLQFLPIYPQQSFYFLGAGRIRTSGVPFVASSTQTSIRGIPLARIDQASVTMAYLRAILALLFVVGIFVMFPVIMTLNGAHLDEGALLVMRGLVVCLVVGVAGGLLTYLVPLTPGRERRIRAYCGELLGICADPARVTSRTAAAMERFVEQHSTSAGDRHRQAKHQNIKRLIKARCRIAQGHQVERMEQMTEELLERLDNDGELTTHLG